ncbi:uncharacterized protein PAF06_011320 [Gastrophryne carolinensis]
MAWDRGMPKRNATGQILGVAGEQTPSFDLTDSPVITLPDWMSHLPDHLPLASLAIPGTHNTMALYGGPVVECQSWSLLNQLKAGIRFLDIRPRHYGNQLAIFHSVAFQRTYLDQVLNDTVAFLTEHPREMVLMRIKEENDAYQVSRSYYKSVAKVINQTGEQWFLKNSSLSTLGKARGKIVILQEFSSNGEGPDFGPLYPGDMSISDEYIVTNDSVKWAEIERHMKVAQDGDPDTVYLTFCSGTHWLLYTPKDLASKINPRVLDYLITNTSSARKRSVGVVIMDFPGAHLVRQIILDNLIINISFLWNLITLNQLKAGIRFLDIRPRHYGNKLPNFYSVAFQCTYLGQVLNDTVAFLMEHPREMALMRVREENNPYQVTRSYYKSVANVVNQTGEHCFLKYSSLSRLGKACGKIIILHEFSSNEEGPDFGPLYPDGMNISDEYIVTNYSVKWAEIERHLKVAQDSDPDTVYLTFCSGTHWLLYTPEDLASKINPGVLDYLITNTSSARRRSVGVVIILSKHVFSKSPQTSPSVPFKLPVLHLADLTYLSSVLPPVLDHSPQVLSVGQHHLE